MGKNTSIEWCHHTFNCWIGCTKVSPGCANCYAETLMDTRYGRVKWGKGNPRSRTSAANWKEPLRWDKEAAKSGVRKRVFCASLADVFDSEVPDAWRLDLFELIDDCKNLDWLLLTKRPENITILMDEVMNGHFEPRKTFLEDMPNVWLGTSVEDRFRANERIPELLKISAKVHFLSMEPLLGCVHIEPYLLSDYDKAAHDSQILEPLEGFTHQKIDWVIVGGESGPGSRPMMSAWVHDIQVQCNEWGTPFFFKQWGGVDKKSAGRELDGETWSAIPSNTKISESEPERKP